MTHEKAGGRQGHKFKDAVSALVVAELFGFTYVYPEYASLDFFNFSEDSILRRDLPLTIKEITIEGPYWQGVSYDQLCTTLNKVLDEDRREDQLLVLKNSYRVQLFQLHQWHENGLISKDLYSSITEKLRVLFRRRNSRNGLYYDPANINIAIHVRRGDIIRKKNKTPLSQHYAFPIEVYDLLISQLRNCFKEYATDIHVYTELHNADDVAEHCRDKPHIKLHRGGREEFHQDFLHMVYSDVLVVSNSSMSQIAGYLSDGVKLYSPNKQYCGLPEDEFLTFDTGGISEAALLGAVQRLRPDKLKPFPA